MLFQSSNSEAGDCPISVRLEASSTSMVKGCPGVPRSIPRIDTMLNIRSITDSPFIIRSVKVQLITKQKVLIPTKFGSNEALKEFVVYTDPLTYMPPRDKFYEVLHGLDIHILIPIPRDITPSAYCPIFGATTLHNLVVLVSLGTDSVSEVTFMDSFPVDIKMYDTLPIYEIYNKPAMETYNSPDNQVLVDTTIPFTAVGPKDELSVICKIKTNVANNKVKKNITLKHLKFELKEVIGCYDGGLPARREVKLCTETKEYYNHLDSQGIQQVIKVNFPYENDYLQMFSPVPELKIEKEVSQDFTTTVIESTNISKLKTIDKLPEGVPVTNIQGFTLLGAFYSIWFEMVIKVKLSNAKDIRIAIPIIVSPFDKQASKYLLGWIMSECDIAKGQFDKYFIDRYYSTTNYVKMTQLLNEYRQPPIIDGQHKHKRNTSNSPQYLDLDLYID